MSQRHAFVVLASAGKVKQTAAAAVPAPEFWSKLVRCSLSVRRDYRRDRPYRSPTQRATLNTTVLFGRATHAAATVGDRAAT